VDPPPDLDPRVTARFRALYGSSPLHLAALAASFALTALAGSKLLDTPNAWAIVAWFLAAILLHDFFLFPVYTLLDRIAGARSHTRLPGSAVNVVRVPALLSALLLLVSIGLVLGTADAYESATGLRPEPYLERWLAVTAVLFLGSGLVYALRVRRARVREHP